MTELLYDLTAARVPWTSPTIASWCTPAELRRRVRAGMAVEAQRTGDVVFGEGYRNDVGRGPEDPLAWANRRLGLAGGGWAVTGVRFRGLDLARPFVDVVATTRPPTPHGLHDVARAVLAAYEDFAPLCLRVDAPDAPGLVERLVADDRFGPSRVDMHVVAGRVEDLRAHPRASSYDAVSLRAVEPVVAAARAAEIYDEATRQAPQLAMWAHAEDAESMGECARQGLLFEVLVDGASAGVVGSVRADAHGMVGFTVQELCLDAAHRGRRLASATVQRLLEALPAGPGDALWGTIHPDNGPSLRNALSVGRTLVGGYVWVTPDGLPGMPEHATPG